MIKKILPAFAFSCNYLPRSRVLQFLFMRKLAENSYDVPMRCAIFFFRRGAEEKVQEKTSEETSRIGDAAESETQPDIATDKHPLPVKVLHHRRHLVVTERRQVLDRDQEESSFQGYLLRARTASASLRPR